MSQTVFMQACDDENPVNRRERVILRLIQIVLLLAITLPYIWVARSVPPGKRYSGLLFVANDQNVHLAWAKQAAQGHFFVRNLFTTEAISSGKPPLFWHPLAWIVGVLSGVSSTPPVFIYHGLRLIFALLAVRWFHFLCCELTKDARVRILATCLFVFSADMGWLQAVLPGIDWMDSPASSMPEAFGFFSFFLFPFNSAALALLALTFALLFRAQRRACGKCALGAGVAAMLAGFIHTYDAVPLAFTLAVWVAIRVAVPRMRSQRRYPLIVLLFALVPVGFQTYVFYNSAEFRLKALQLTPPPNLTGFVFSYALLLIPAVCVLYEIFCARQKANSAVDVNRANAAWLVVWMAAIAVLIYTPISFSGKMIEGFSIPLCFFAAVGWVRFCATKLPLSERRWSRSIVIGALVPVSCISSAIFVRWCMFHVNDDPLRSPYFVKAPLFIEKTDDAALRYLAVKAAPEQAILCLPMLGNYVPRATGRYTYVGHWAETLGYFGDGGKLDQAMEFYLADMPRARAVRWLHDNHINYIIEGHYENIVAQSLRRPLPSKRYNFSPLFRQGETSVYAVP